MCVCVWRSRRIQICGVVVVTIEVWWSQWWLWRHDCGGLWTNCDRGGGVMVEIVPMVFMGDQRQWIGGGHGGGGLGRPWLFGSFSFLFKIFCPKQP